MSITVDGQLPVFSYRHAVRMARRTHMAAGWWASLANSFRSTIGPLPGRAFLLMHRVDIANINTGNAHTVTFTDIRGGTITLNGIWFIKSERILPGGPNDPNALLLTEWADPRWFARNPFYGNPAMKNYNVRAPAGGQTYYADSLNAGNPWTWQQILDDLWATIAAGAPMLGAGSPQLPAAAMPDGTPEGFRFLGVPAWDAYNQLLDRLGCGVSWDAVGNGPRLFQHLATDPSFDQANQQYANRAIYDSGVLFAANALMPEKLRVYFPQIRQDYGTELATDWAAGNQDSMTPLFSIDQPDPNGNLPGVQAGTLATVFDDLPAILDFNGAITNMAALTSRSMDRAVNYFNANRPTNTRQTVKIYSGIIPDPNLIQLRSWVNGICFRESGGGTQTEVVRYPVGTPPASIKFTDDREWGGAGGGMAGGAAEVMQRMKPPDLGRVTFPVYPPLQQFCMCTNAMSVAPNTFSGQVTRVNPRAQTSANRENCFIMVLTGGSLTAGQFVECRLCGTATIGGNTLPLYATVPGGSGGAGLTPVRVTTGTPNASGLYTAIVQSVNIAGLPTPFSDSATNCYWYEANNTGALNIIPRGYYFGSSIGTNGGLTVYALQDFNLTVKDVFNNVVSNNVNEIDFDSTGSTTADWVLSLNGRKLTVRLNGETATKQVCEGDGTFHTWKFEHGLKKP